MKIFNPKCYDVPFQLSFYLWMFRFCRIPMESSHSNIYFIVNRPTDYQAVKCRAKRVQSFAKIQLTSWDTKKSLLGGWVGSQLFQTSGEKKSMVRSLQRPLREIGLLCFIEGHGLFMGRLWDFTSKTWKFPSFFSGNCGTVSLVMFFDGFRKPMSWKSLFF